MDIEDIFGEGRSPGFDEFCDRIENGTATDLEHEEFQMRLMRSARYEQYGDLFVGGPLYFASGEDALGVTVKQQGKHHLWRVRRTSVTSIRLFYWTCVQLLHNLDHKTSQTVFIQPTLAVSWYVDRLVSVNVDKMIANGLATFSVIANTTLF